MTAMIAAEMLRWQLSSDDGRKYDDEKILITKIE